MTVQSARVQSLVIGDDVTLKHQLVKQIALDASFSIAPVEITNLDKVIFFYELADGVDLIGYEGVVVGSYPSSKFSVDIAGVIPLVVDVSPVRGSSTFLEGLGQTVRAEIIRDFATTPKKETIYLLKEVDVIARGFPVEAEQLNLP